MNLNLTGEINLEQIIGKNSRIDDEGRLIIKNVVAFAPGQFISDSGKITKIGEDIVRSTDWVELLQGVPVIRGHSNVLGDTFSELTRGTVKAVRSNDKVIVDLLIIDSELIGKIISGELRSVSLSFMYEEDTKKITSINHLGVVFSGQVPEAVINLEKQGEEMEIEKLKQENSEMKKRISDLEKEKQDFNLEKQLSEAEEKGRKESQEKFDQEKLDLENKIKQEYEVKLEAISLGIATEGTAEEITDKVNKFKLAKVEQVFGKLSEGADLNTAFSLAVAKENKEKAENSNVNLSNGETEKPSGDIAQSRAEKFYNSNNRS